jgi:hypothetical protein
MVHRRSPPRDVGGMKMMAESWGSLMKLDGVAMATMKWVEILLLM